jgi:hypothetical protein
VPVTSIMHWSPSQITKAAEAEDVVLKFFTGDLGELLLLLSKTFSAAGDSWIVSALKLVMGVTPVLS